MLHMHAGAPPEMAVGTARRCTGALEEATANVPDRILIHCTRRQHTTAF
jgi:hypothetical protein